MQIPRRLFEILMPQQDLDGAQVRSGFEQVGGETMTQDVGVNGLVDTGPLGGIMASVPNRPAGDRIIAVVPLPAGEQPLLGPAPQSANVLSQGDQQLLGGSWVSSNRRTPVA